MTTTMDLAAFARSIGKWPKNLEKAGIRALRSAAVRGVGVVVENIDSPSAGHPPPVDTGALRSSVRAHPVHLGAVLIVEAPHAIYMEKGTRPHYPPIGPLWTWVVRKIPTSSDAEALGIAFAIQQKIGEEGVEPRHFFQRSMRVIRGKIVPAELRSEFSKSTF